MQLFYAPDLDPCAQEYQLSEEESRHCIRVLRLRCGDTLHLTDGRGTLCVARITAIEPRSCTLRIEQRLLEFEKRPYTLHIAIAPTKNTDRLEWFVEKATEIGIDRITPLLTAHCERRTLKNDRLERVAIGAVKQSLKAYHPQIDPITPIDELLRLPFEGRKLIAHCEQDAQKQSLRTCVAAGESVLILIGPEGDFSTEEIAQAMAHGFQPVSLGSSRLRTETAGVVAAHAVAWINERE